MFPPVAFLSLLIELLAGYPDWLFRVIGHPVTWIGKLISLLDRHWNRDGDRPAQRRALGVAALLVLLAVSIGTGMLIQWSLALVPYGIIGTAILASSLIAQRSLHFHVAAVAAALGTGGLEAGRKAVSQIVGRDPDRLDEAGVCRAAIESLAENFSDGIVAPVIWMALAGLPGAAAYKAVNTADSMIGHKSERHRDFGWASARFDDLVNWPASRLSALLIVGAAALLPAASPAAAWKAVRRDARGHRSPNAGWPEAATAGALGLSIAGPRYYHGVQTTDAEIGAGGRREANAADIRRALALYRIADAMLVALTGLIAATVILSAL
jgi:adenosylcobinamide-phosphate synthase